MNRLWQIWASDSSKISWRMPLNFLCPLALALTLTRAPFRQGGKENGEVEIVSDRSFNSVIWNPA
jgi:hypothetical protein